MVRYGPWQNKKVTVTRFVTDLTKKYDGWKKPIFWLFPPTYSCVRSVTNLITNNLNLYGTSVKHLKLIFEINVHCIALKVKVTFTFRTMSF